MKQNSQNLHLMDISGCITNLIIFSKSDIYGPLGMLRSAVGKPHDLRSDLWWTIPLHILLDRFGIPLGFLPIKSALARHSGVQVPVISRHEGHVPINIGTFQFLPTGLHGLCFGFCFAGPFPLRSLSHGPLLRVHFGESLVIDYTQKSTISTSAVKLSVSAINFGFRLLLSRGM